jgi:predicted GNAT superfamily acetyltransferase
MTCESVDLTLDAPSLLVEIPTGFTELQATDPELAYNWRLATRGIFETYFGRGYRVVDFFLNREEGVGAYLLAPRPAFTEAADQERDSSS